MAAAAGIGDAWKGAQHTSSNGVFLSRGTSARTHAETNLHVMYVRTVQLIVFVVSIIVCRPIALCSLCGCLPLYICIRLTIIVRLSACLCVCLHFSVFSLSLLPLIYLSIARCLCRCLHLCSACSLYNQPFVSRRILRVYNCIKLRIESANVRAECVPSKSL